MTFGDPRLRKVVISFIRHSAGASLLSAFSIRIPSIFASHLLPCFSCSSSKPDPRSRRLYAGCQLGTAQVTPQPRPRAITPPGFDTALVISTRHRTVHFRSTPRITPDAVKLRLFHRRSSPGLLTPATRGGLMPAPACRHRGALPHLR